MFEIPPLLFYLVSGVTVFGAIGMLLTANPVFSALLLVVAMSGVAGVFFTLGAYFIAASQLIVYAGAVMVLFVMVVMLFNLKEEKQAFDRGVFSGLLKLFSFLSLILLLVFGIVLSSKFLASSFASSKNLVNDSSTKDLAVLLFSKYSFPFEVISLVLLLVVVGVVALAKSAGGTHASGN